MVAFDELTLLAPDARPQDGPVPPVTGDDGDLNRVIERMLYIICRTGHPSLSGPQVGLDRRIVAIDLSRTGQRPVVLVNPEIEATSIETQVDTEGCLHHPGVLKRVERPVQVTVTGTAPSGQTVRLHAGGFLARLLQHQMDHLDGRPFGGGGARADRAAGKARAGGGPHAPAEGGEGGVGSGATRDEPGPGIGAPGDGRASPSCSVARPGPGACRIA